MQKISPILVPQALNCLKEVECRRRQAKILGRIEDTVRHQGKPLNEDPRGTAQLCRKPTQVGGAGPKKLKEQGVVGVSAPPPIPQLRLRHWITGGGGVEQVLRTR